MRYFNELYIVFIEVGGRKDEIVEVIQGRGRFTDAFRLDTKIKREGIYAISFDGKYINYFAKGKKSGRIATYKDRLTFSDFIEVNIPLKELNESIPRLEDRFNNGGSVVRIPPATTTKVYNQVEYYESEFAKWLKEVTAIKKNTLKNRGQIERNDSYKLILNMADFDLKNESLVTRTSGVVPNFLEEINSVKVNEDEMINYDFSVFGDWKKYKEDIVGMAHFAKENENLFIWNINRKPLESVLGVDLIYFVEEYNSFVMVQYKRMKKESDKWIYRANDKAYKKELCNMKRFENLTHNKGKNKVEPSQFRLNNSPYYFKLCKSVLERENQYKSDLIPGMYIPLEYWENMISHPSFAKGERGGIAIGYHNAKRWLTSGDFTRLVQKGWIGSSLESSSIISRLIEGSIKGDRAVTLAAKVENA